MDSRIGIQDKIIILSQVGKKLFRGFFKRFYLKKRLVCF